MTYAKIVKLSIYTFFAFTVVAFVYSLGFSTDYVQIRGSYREFYDEGQAFNKIIFNLSVLTFVELMFLINFENHKKITYKLHNTIIGLIVSIQTIIISIYSIITIGSLKSDYLTINPENVHLLYPDFEVGTFIFNIGYVVYGLYALSALSVLLITIISTRKYYSKRKDSE